MTDAYERYEQICAIVAGDERGSALLADFMDKACEYLFSRSESSRNAFLKTLTELNDYCCMTFGNCPEQGIVPSEWQADSGKLNSWIGELVYTIYIRRQR